MPLEPRAPQQQQHPSVCHVIATEEGAKWLLAGLQELRDRFGYRVAAVIAPGPGSLSSRLRAAK